MRLPEIEMDGILGRDRRGRRTRQPQQVGQLDGQTQRPARRQIRPYATAPDAASKSRPSRGSGEASKLPGNR